MPLEILNCEKKLFIMMKTRLWFKDKVSKHFLFKKLTSKDLIHHLSF